jgi:hypothetical protein
MDRVNSIAREVDLSGVRHESLEAARAALEFPFGKGTKECRGSPWYALWSRPLDKTDCLNPGFTETLLLGFLADAPCKVGLVVQGLKLPAHDVLPGELTWAAGGTHPIPTAWIQYNNLDVEWHGPDDANVRALYVVLDDKALRDLDHKPDGLAWQAVHPPPHTPGPPVYLTIKSAMVGLQTTRPEVSWQMGAV